MKDEMMLRLEPEVYLLPKEGDGSENRIAACD